MIRRIECDECGGNGTIACPECDGHDVDENGDTCPHCEGFGAIICEKCNGTGGIDVEIDDDWAAMGW